jgi:hypothetical protein
MTMYKLTAAEKTEKARSRYHVERPQQTKKTLCASCIHRPDPDFNCRQFSQTSGESQAGFLIVLFCDGYTANG